MTICCTQFGSPFCEQPIWMIVMIAAPMMRADDGAASARQAAAADDDRGDDVELETDATVGSPTDSFENCSSPATPANAADIV